MSEWDDKADFNRHTATLYTIANIMDVGQQLLRQSGLAHVRSLPQTLPRTYEDYIARLYGARGRDWSLVLNYGLLAAMVALIVAIAAVWR